MKIKKIVFISIYILVIIGIISLFIMINMPNGIFGYTLRRIETGSMLPTISEKAIIVIKLGCIDEINEQDIVCFVDPVYGEVAHRIVDIKEDDEGIKYVTKGDANVNNDIREATQETIVGKVIKIINL